MVRTLILAYIVFAPFTTWLALSGWLRLPVVCILLALLLAFPFLLARLSGPRAVLRFEQEDLFFLLVLLATAVSIAANDITGKTPGHTLAYLFSFLVYYLGLRVLLALYDIRFSTVSQMASRSTLLCCGLITIEWGLANFFSIYIRKWLVFDETTSNMLYYNQFFFKSVGGVAEEPSLMAFNLNMFMALGMYHAQRQGRPFRNFYLIAYLLAMFFLASSGGIGFIVLAFLAVFVNRAQGYVNLAKVFVIAVLPLFVFYQLNSIFVEQRITAFIETIYNKFTFQHNSANMRVWAWENAISDWLDSPIFGQGPGYGNLEHYDGFGYQSFYFKLLAENGLAALLAMLAFFGVLVLKARFMEPKTRPYLMLALLAGFFHLSIQDAFYHPALWVCIVATQQAWREQRAARHQSEWESPLIPEKRIDAAHP